MSMDKALYQPGFHHEPLPFVKQFLSGILKVGGATGALKAARIPGQHISLSGGLENGAVAQA
jgi:hypothetical protein